MTRSIKAALFALALSIVAPVAMTSSPAQANNINQPHVWRPDRDHRHDRDWRRNDHRDHRHDRRRDDHRRGRDHDRHDRGNSLQRLFP